MVHKNETIQKLIGHWQATGKLMEWKESMVEANGFKKIYGKKPGWLLGSHEKYWSVVEKFQKVIDW